MIKSRMFLRSKMGEIVLAITDEVANHFSGLDLNELTVCSDYIANTFTEISFHEAFRNDVNKIVLQSRATTYLSENKELAQKLIDQQKVNDQRFCDLFDSTKAQIDNLKKVQEEGIFYIGNLKLFIQHLQDYIAAKHLESEGLILEKFIQEEPYHGRKESTNSQP